MGARHAGRGYDDRVTDPNQEPGESEPGEPPAAIPPVAEPVTPGERRLAHPPSDRYRLAEAPPADAPPDPAASVVRGVAIAVVAAGIGAVAIVVLGGVLTVTAGLVIVAAAIGWGVGAGLRFGAGPDLPPRRRVVIAVVLAIVSVALGQVGLWQYGRTEGGVLAPLDYLAEVYGPLVPVQLVVAAVAAWVGAR
jgi:hypothetical protein